MEQRCKRKFKRFKKLGEIKLRVWKEFIDNRGEGKCLYDFRFDRDWFFDWNSLFVDSYLY